MSSRQTTKYSICFLYCYFGKLPWYFRFFVQSCSYNPDIDFVLVTDQVVKDELPANVIIKNYSLDEVRALASERLGFEVKIPYSYKLCDLKPAYGVIFEDMLEGYEFWGFGDIDVIFGDLRAFLTHELLDNHDGIFIRKEYSTGYFSIFRNTHEFKRVFQISRDHKMVFQSPRHFCFDECNFKFMPLWEGVPIEEVQFDVECLTYILQVVLKNKARFYFKTIDIEECKLKELPTDIEWRKGKLFYKNKEVILYHLIFLKRVPLIYIPRWRKLPDRYFISEISFSRLPPGSLLGKLQVKLVKKAIWLKSNLDYSLVLLSAFAKKRMKIEYDKFGKVVGKYHWLHIFHITIFHENDSLCCIFGSEKPVALIPLNQGSSFLLLKRRIEIKFWYDEMNGTQAMSVNILTSNKGTYKFYMC